MNGKQLKNSILQWAIQGKLVPQDPNDEPASVLLEKIRVEKERLVKEGKLKKKDLESKPIEEEEIPFEIPKTWKWCRIEDLFIHASGKQQSSSSNGKGSPQKFITTSNLYWGRFVLDKVKVMNFTEEEIKTCSATKGDLLVCEGGAGYGRSAIWDKDYDICLQNHVHRLRPVIDGICEYVYHFIYYLKESNQLMSVGTAMPGLSANRLKGLVLPLPPLSEQHRIVAKIEELMPLVEKYGETQEALEEWNNSLPEKLKKSILQEAIQGKLVPQDPADEPASVLQERIREEKQRLVKEGKLKKKDLEVKTIEEDEVPFEIPENWEWVRLGVISTYSHTKKKVNASKADPQIWGLDLEDIEKGGKLLCIKTVEERKAVGDKTYFNSGDILYSKLRPYLLKILIAPKEGVCTPEIIPFTCYGDISSNYIVDVLKSSYVDDYINSVTYGVKMPRVSTDTMTSLLVPLPPLAEQRRIVAKIEELFGVIKK